MQNSLDGLSETGGRDNEIAPPSRERRIIATDSERRSASASRGLPTRKASLGKRNGDVARLPLKGHDAPSSKPLDEAAAEQGAERVRPAPPRSGGAIYLPAAQEDLAGHAYLLTALHEVSDQLLHAQETERQRIAIELHDSMHQHLAGLALSLVALRKRINENPGAQALMDDMAKLIEQAVKETRVLSYLMNASQRTREGLQLSVRRFVEGFGRRADLAASVSATGPVDSVSVATQHAVFRIVQEALSNVYRHAHATKVSVRLTHHADRLTVRIADDGRGVRPAVGTEDGEAALGVGIRGMRARIDQLGGTLAITPGTRRGTVVTATVPTPPGMRPRRRARADEVGPTGIGRVATQPIGASLTV